MTAWTETPENAWAQIILPAASSDANWLQDSKDISEQIQVSKRELFTLIIMAQLHGKEWHVGYDPAHGEPNDGYISNGSAELRFEHKLVPSMAKNDVLSEILSTYEKYDAKGMNYGKGMSLVIQPNKESDHGGLVRISDLARKIGETSHFDRVFTLSMCATKDEGKVGVMHISQHYPKPTTDPGLSEVCFNFSTGMSEVTLRSDVIEIA